MNASLAELLRAHNLRNTTARHTIFKLLKQRGATSTAELSRQTRSLLDTASLYRTLALFRKLGIVQDVVIAGQRKVELTDRFTGHHHHLACQRCDTTIAIHDAQFEQQIERLASVNGFTHQSHSFEITGLCPSCQQKTSALGSDGAYRQASR